MEWACREEVERRGVLDAPWISPWMRPACVAEGISRA